MTTNGLALLHPQCKREGFDDSMDKEGCRLTGYVEVRKGMDMLRGCQESIRGSPFHVARYS